MEEQKLIPKVFGWMFIGLIVTFLTGFYVSNNVNMVYNISNSAWTIALVEIILVVVLSMFSHKMNYYAAVFLFVVYAFVTGLTFSAFFLLYQMSSIMSIFLVSALIFGGFALLGYKTKVDLSKFSTIFMMILLGGLIVSIVNIFLGNTLIDTIVSWVLLIVFFGITAYDMQKIKRIAYQIGDSNKVTIICALDLYLDFINIFIRLLSLFGKSKD